MLRNARDRPLKVYVTLLEQKSSISADLRRQKIVEILEKLAASQTFAEVTDPVPRQRDIRQDR
jgi:crotonobetainyl-CoA:carnitine CoA-transferase CaiB-like acyl-CoA transferase